MTIVFTSHNVTLPDGRETVPGRVLVSDSGACRAALRYLEAEFGNYPASVADLGCLEGGYSAEFARAGYEVTGIEARKENYDSAVWLKMALGLPNLRFVRGDVQKVLPGMEFDAVFCSGLLYHLDRPVAFLNLLGQVTHRMLILNTHISMEYGHPESVHQPGERCEPSTQSNEGRLGHWFHETDNQWASWSNKRSFWLQKGELMNALCDAGFTRVEERSDWRGGNAMPWGSGGEFPDRGMFVAYK